MKLSEFKKQAMESVKETEPLYTTKDGLEVFTLEDARDVMETIATLEKTGVKIDRDLGEPDFNHDGMTHKSTGKTILVTNPAKEFENRFRKVKDKVYDVVVDKRAIKEQSKGKIYATAIQSYRLTKNKDGKYVVNEINQISDKDFIKDFRKKFDQDSMLVIKEAINDIKNSGIDEEKLV